MWIIRRYGLLFLLVSFLKPAECLAQTPDSSILDQIQIPEKYKFIRGIFEDAKNSIIKNNFDTAHGNVVLLTQSENIFKEHEGKIIRNIKIRRYDFARTFSDTADKIRYFGTRLLNALHTDTKEFVIRDNVFVRENTRLNPYVLADNERYLRNIDFIRDARIIVIPIPKTDSVDILIVTKDLFSIKVIADVSGFDINRVRTRVSESNFAGTAQRIQVTGLWQRKRNPTVGYEIVYGKNNIAGSFVNAAVGYTNVNTGRSEGQEEEYAFFIRMDRPLVSPFSQLAGGMEVSFNHSVNVFNKSDSFYYDYRYHLFDFWGGINLGADDIREGMSSFKRRDRKFISARYIHHNFLKKPFQVGERIDPVYNDRQMFLGQISFFRQEYYKMNYMYGFGTTEDIPTGYNISITAGWHRQLKINRPYGGVEIDKYHVSNKGAFMHATLRSGGFYRNDALEDASLLVGANYFTQLFPVKKWKMRQQIRASYTQLNNRVTYFPLYLNNAYGPPNFNSSQVFGEKRISLYAESVLYLNKKYFGFSFAPFFYGNSSLLTPERNKFLSSPIYPSIGGGIRTRNENLIFGTIELKASYFPRHVPGLKGFQFYITSDIRFRYRTNFVKAPDVIQLNFEDVY